MKTMDRVPLMAIGFWTVGLLLTACGSAPSSSANTGAGSTIQVWTMEDSKSFTALMQDFTKQTGINVQVTAVPWDNVNDKLTTAVASGNGPDVTQIGLSLLPSFQTAGGLLNLSPYLKDHPGLLRAKCPSAEAVEKI